jgi:hypothetical protein
METAKNNLRICVKKYSELFPAELRAFKQGHSNMESAALNTDTIETKVAEYPENLYMMILRVLDDKQLEWFNSKEGIRWFVKAFPIFAVKFKSNII